MPGFPVDGALTDDPPRKAGQVTSSPSRNRLSEQVLAPELSTFHK